MLFWFKVQQRTMSMVAFQVISKTQWEIA